MLSVLSSEAIRETKINALLQASPKGPVPDFDPAKSAGGEDRPSTTRLGDPVGVGRASPQALQETQPQPGYKLYHSIW